MKYSKDQLKIIATFFSNIAVAWFSGGILASYFVVAPILKKLLLAGPAIFFMYFFFMISLYVSEKITK
ncbi:hypothetical protein A3H80_00380 [Candidatus Roizmanbacteria bacterium RIFCSPLOWO2_02_FULL_37_19]|uniref:EamA domain-containing protein n=1 Tax=Candidatus Roizmanbacteria bacterium RIFCSPHIGHO2_02_FULL_37_24 TaxID=1802037 RepID=A0A1F7GZV9_9BACT|nr:MAG: hypothetical protein A2862_04860 [Candidatus Roizmanbacteria bacterium RIFCSPHIGHO2_01_FULL_38_41]OGK24448.1 MAG: hypothetical protein A3C24_02090 [Candidatus Roizmanbacteria bacterium RIFCSPHIGHO2_02_FULL_37_24]OGK32662.1 MAG: hypothetical protein A3E10_01560 [Candidatus Roizmanbacteria bacterium RIFCSPHIGHO2_12_FULL_37_23]OGK44772.1 MAG: hypothetical protein A2956_01590 [Candidatus Roizmanbacteria bacterium RIFCSPLOWO2_01_FULL_37_57]OGK53976.1 MAG: hypothetical protein A3H80_00380 [Ca